MKRMDGVFRGKRLSQSYEHPELNTPGRSFPGVVISHIVEANNFEVPDSTHGGRKIDEDGF